MLSTLTAEIHAGFSDLPNFVSFTLRMAVAALLGALIGFQRERWGKPAGIRTHMLLAVGTTLLTATVADQGAYSDAASRVIQGIATGIGFLGAGVILKIDAEADVRGLTTAAGIWTTAAISVAVGLRMYSVAMVATAFAFIILAGGGAKDGEKDR